MNDLIKSGLLAAGWTVALFTVFVVVYWAFRGFLPGSRVVEQPLVAPNDLDTKTAKFKLFYVNWCPHSKEALEKITEFEGLLSQFRYGGKRVVIEKIDCETNKDECALYNVDAYPTYKLETNSKMYEYVGPASVQTYVAFLTSALGKETPA
jgi:hypothetical protein